MIKRYDVSTEFMASDTHDMTELDGCLIGVAVLKELNTSLIVLSMGYGSFNFEQTLTPSEARDFANALLAAANESESITK